MNRSVSILASIIILWGTFSCEEKEPCVGCSSEIKSSFEDQPFTVFSNDVDTFLIDYDSEQSTAYVFMTCSAELLRSFETDNVILVSGSFRGMCGSNVQVIAIEEVELVETCLPTIPQLSGPYTLNNSWLIQSIQTQDTTAYTPCGVSTSVAFNTVESGIESAIGPTSSIGEYELINDSTIQMPGSFIRPIVVANSSQLFFRNLFDEVVGPRSLITYSIHNNLLTLKNKANNSSISLFLTE